MFNILHLADIHLGAVPYGMRARGQDIDFCLGQITQMLSSGRWDAVVVSGDTFDTSQIHPMDHESLRNLLTEATGNRVPVYWIEGDHDSVRRDKIRRDARSWPEVFQNTFYVFPEQLDANGLPVPYVLEKAGHRPLTICPINWRPGSEIRELIGRLPNDYCDLMILHQSLEGVIPAIANPELRIQDIDGKAAHFAMGDLHVNHAAVLPSGAVAAYPGPIEWLATDQIDQTGFRQILFGEDGSFHSTAHIRTASRRLVRLMIARDEVIDLQAAMLDEAWEPAPISSRPVEVGSPGCSVRFLRMDLPTNLRHRYFFDIRYFHSPTGELRDLARSVQSQLEAQVPNCLARISQIPSVDSAEVYTNDEIQTGDEFNSTLSMEEAIRQHCANEEDPRILQTALDIWAHPGSVENIINRNYETEETEAP